MNDEIDNRGAEHERRQPELSIVVTLYNEEENVEPFTTNLINIFRERLPDRQFELVLVLNGPRDRTGEIAVELEQRFSQIRLVSLQENRGFGGGIRAGLQAARADVIGFLDGDEQIAADDVVSIFSIALSDPCDIVKASRLERHDGLQRRMVSGAYNAIFRIMFGGVSKDINGKPKVLKKAALELLHLQSNDWFLDAELMIQARRKGLTIKEVPVVFRQRARGTSKVRASTLIEFLRNLLVYRCGKN